MKPSLPCLTVLLGVLLSAPVTAGGDAFVLEPIAPGAWVHPGRHAALDDPARADSANLGVVAGTRCVAVIDTGGALATGRALADAVRRVADRPVCYVINTHVHFDHVLGNAAFTGGETHFVGHQRLAEALEANREFFAESFAAELGDAKVITPDLLVEQTLELDLGERVLLLQAVTAAHTHTDLTVLDSASGTLFAGDLLFRERMPVLDGSLRGWLGWMEAAMREPYAHVVPGHGAVDGEWPAGAADQWRYLSALLEETRAAIARGWFLDEAKAGVASGERERWLLSERAHGLNVSRAFRELEWE